MIKNIFISGKPGCGKTTLIMEILKELNLDAGGFYTSEIRDYNPPTTSSHSLRERAPKGIRKGFKIVSLNGKEGILAHVNIKSPYKVSKYGVNIKDLEEIGVKAILDALRKNKIIIIDEVGKAEMFSKKFREAVLIALNSKNRVLGTIKLTHDPFTDKIKKRKDTKIFYLTKENKEKIKKEIKILLKNGKNNYR